MSTQRPGPRGRGAGTHYPHSHALLLGFETRATLTLPAQLGLPSGVLSIRRGCSVHGDLGRARARDRHCGNWGKRGPVPRSVIVSRSVSERDPKRLAPRREWQALRRVRRLPRHTAVLPRQVVVLIRGARCAGHPPGAVGLQPARRSPSATEAPGNRAWARRVHRGLLAAASFACSLAAGRALRRGMRFRGPSPRLYS